MLEASILAALSVMAVSLIGVVFTVGFAKRFFEGHVSYLISFSAGVFLVTAITIGYEVVELSEGAVMLAVSLVAIGYVLASLIHFLLPETHHHHDEDCHAGHRGAKKLLVGDALHNLADGIVIVTAFSVSPLLGGTVLISILIHESLQEISEFFVLRQNGYSIKRALAVNFLVSGTVVIGVLLGHYALVSHELELLLLALSTGFLVHVVVHDLLPKRHHHEHGSFKKHLLVVVVGALVMALAQFAVEGHSHDHGHDHEEGTEIDHID